MKAETHSGCSVALGRVAWLQKQDRPMVLSECLQVGDTDLYTSNYSSALELGRLCGDTSRDALPHQCKARWIPTPLHIPCPMTPPALSSPLGCLAISQDRELNYFLDFDTRLFTQGWCTWSKLSRRIDMKERGYISELGKGKIEIQTALCF